MAQLHLHLATVVALCVTRTLLARPQDLQLPYTYPPEPVPNTTSLYFGLMQSFGGTYNSLGSIPGVELALDNINKDKTILNGYTLHYVLRDSFVSQHVVYYFSLPVFVVHRHET